MTGDEVAGAVTRFENFQGDRLSMRYGPADGKLEKEPESIAIHDSGVWTRDLVVEAEFINPQEQRLVAMGSYFAIRYLITVGVSRDDR